MANQAQPTEVLGPVSRLLYAVRWVILAFVFVAVWQLDFHTALVKRAPIMIIVGAWAVVMLISHFSGWLSWMRQSIFSVMTDVVMISAISYFSDGIHSPFYALYYITIVTAAVDLGLFGAVISALVIAVLSLYIETISPTIHPTIGQYLPQDIVRTVPYLFLIAFITGVLRNRVRVLDEAASTLRAEQAANERELEVAAEVQRAQLPVSLPQVEGVRIATMYKPAREVGGDLYDFYPVEEKRLGVLIADVMGKGIPAALLVCACKYGVRMGCAGGLDTVMTSTNEELLASTNEEIFVTMAYGILDVSEHTFRYVSAGHMPPIVLKKDGTVTLAEQSDPPLGITQECAYTERCLQLDPGDTLVLYTDGMTDSLSKGADGIDCFRAFVADMGSRNIDEWGDEFLRRTPSPDHVDDLTMVILRLED